MVLLPASAKDALAKSGAFTVRVMPSDAWLAIRQQQHQSLPWHESVLRPILRAADAAWAYELTHAPEIFAVAHGILRRDRGKYAIELGGEPIVGHELLWNASGGVRGSILVKMPLAKFPSAAIFPHCQDAFVVGNSTVAHSKAAVRFARQAVNDGQTLCCLLSRTNGFEWFSVYASLPALESLLVQARSLVARREWYQSAV